MCLIQALKLTNGGLVLERIGTLSKDDDDGNENVGEKNDFAFFQTYTRLFGPSQYVKCRRLFLELNS